jgi:indolepyruvate ferredoxin oxidoreductase, beta subunit
MAADRPLCVMISALGGQGGGVLAEWLADAADKAGFPAQSTSIPGVAQRTGATTYYFELLPDPEPPASPVFNLFPSTDDVDLVAALEPIEAGRALENGFVTSRTTVVTSMHHIYSTAEKVIAGDGAVAVPPVLEGLERAAGRLITLAGGTGGSRLNAVMFGAIAGCGVLPLSEDLCREAIEDKGVAVDANLAGFAEGLRLARDHEDAAATPTAFEYTPAPADFDPRLQDWPADLRPLLGHGLARLVDYQNRRYAERYLARMDRVLETDRNAGGERRGFALSRETARRLAAWMSFEDVIRVAQLKTRPGRLARIRGELGAADGEPVSVVDYLKPGRAELVGTLPMALARLLPEKKTRDAPDSGRAMRIRTSSPLGYASFKLLAAMRPLRPRSDRYRQEQAAIEKWLNAVVTSADVDYDLACQVAGLAVWARGYGVVRARGLNRLNTLLADWEQKLANDPSGTAAQVAASLEAARNDPDADCGG